MAKLLMPVSQFYCFSLQPKLAAWIECRSIDLAKLKLKRFPAGFRHGVILPARRANVEMVVDNAKSRLSPVRASRYKPKLTTQIATKQPKGLL
jgi:hypothetical protein